MKSLLVVLVFTVVVATVCSQWTGGGRRYTGCVACRRSISSSTNCRCGYQLFRGCPTGRCNSCNHYGFCNMALCSRFCETGFCYNRYTGCRICRCRPRFNF